MFLLCFPKKNSVHGKWLPGQLTPQIQLTQLKWLQWGHGICKRRKIHSLISLQNVHFFFVPKFNLHLNSIKILRSMLQRSDFVCKSEYGFCLQACTHAQQVPAEVGWGHQKPWNWSHRWLWTGIHFWNAILVGRYLVHKSQCFKNIGIPYWAQV